MNLKHIYKKIRKDRRLRNAAPYIEIGENTLCEDTIAFSFFQPIKGKKYVVIGNNCMIGANFVFETSEGYIKVGNRCQLSGSVTIISRCGITIDDDVVIAGDTLLYDHDSHSIYWKDRQFDVIRQLESYQETGNAIANKDWSSVKTEEIHISAKVWIGKGVTILKGVNIGEGAVIGAMSVVTKDVPPYTVVAGNPAKVVKYIQGIDHDKAKN